jgi:hypothetical protein
MLLFLVCGSVFAWLFGAQLGIHDYYVMSIFYPLLAFALTLSILNLHKAFAIAPSKQGRVVRIALSATMLVIFFFTDHQLYERQTVSGAYSYPYYAYVWMQNGAKTLDSLQIPGKEQILALDESSPNLTLLYFDRKGYNLDRGKWYLDADLAAKYMRERHINVAVCKEETVRRLKDDTRFVRNFDILSLKDSKAVLRLKPDS